jgi:hypothetical protein
MITQSSLLLLTWIDRHRPALDHAPVRFKAGPVGAKPLLPPRCRPIDTVILLAHQPLEHLPWLPCAGLPNFLQPMTLYFAL